MGIQSDSQQANTIQWAALTLRWALAISFLSAVADRFGMWGPPGATLVGWGDWQHFIAYTAKLNSFLPVVLIQPAGVLATILEVVFSIALIAGIYLRYTAYASGMLLLLFALTMTFALGVKAPLNYSVFSAAAGAFLLGAISDCKCSLNFK